jgi:flavodoxin
MKSIIIYSSKHHLNTEKVALAIGAELGAELKRLADAKPADIDVCDLVGFGSGINEFNVHPELIAMAEGLSDRRGQKAFVFSTCASRKDWTGKFRKLLAAKGFEVVGEFHCAGLWTPGRLKVRAGHPDEADLEAAREFARGLLRGL